MTDGPQTRESLQEQFRALGVKPGGTLLLHASLSSLGWVCGGAVAVVQALLDALGPAGTLVVPAQTTENKDPSRWDAPHIPSQWWPQIRAHLPAFDPAISPCHTMGVIAETVRTWPGSVRSPHPQTSFAALGPRAAELMARHDLESELGEHSPLGALEAAGAEVLLLGVGYDRCTAFHLAEYRRSAPTPRENSCVVATSHGRQWISYTGIDLDASDFARLGAGFETTGGVSLGMIGAARARLFPLPAASAYALTWMSQHRPRTGAMEPA